MSAEAQPPDDPATMLVEHWTLVHDWRHLEDYLPNQETDRHAILCRLIVEDLANRYILERPPLIKCLQRFPELRPGDVPTELIARDYRLRREAGEQPDVAEYLLAFPGRGEALKAALDAVEVELLRDARERYTQLLVAGGGFPHIPGYEFYPEPPREGAMGVVFHAKDTRLNRDVALKAIRPEHLTRRDMLDRFREEARTLASLKHPNIVPLWVSEAHNELQYFTMPWIEGGSLAQALEERDWPIDNRSSERDVAALMIKVARGVAAANSNGFIHLDLKPSNILLDGREPLVGDFGVAHLLAGQVTRNPLGLSYGTPYCRPPEVTSGARPTARADVYGLGAVLHYLLTGLAPPRPTDGPADTAAGAVVLKSGWRRPSRELLAICRQCLQREPAQRYESADAFEQDLQNYLDHRPLKALPPGKAARAVLWARRHPVLLGIVLAFALGVAVGVPFILWQWLRAEGEVANVRAQKRQNVRSLYVANARLAQEAWQGGRYDRLRELLCELRPEQTAGEDLRSFEYYFLARLSRQSRIYLRGHDDTVTRVICSPDGRIATAGRDGAIRLWEADGRPLHTLPEHDGWVGHLSFDGTGRRLASAGNDAVVKVWDVATGGQVLALPGAGRCAVLSSQGDRLACGDGRDGDVTVRDVTTQHVLLRTPGGEVSALAFSPDGRRLAIAGPGKDVFILDVADGREVHRLSHPRNVSDVLFSPDGTQLAVATDNLWLWTFGEPVSSRRLMGTFTWITQVSYSADGRHVAAVGNDETAHVWESTTGVIVDPAGAYPLGVQSAAFGADGRRLILACGKEVVIELWRTPAVAPERRWPGHTKSVLSVAFRPGGSWLASAGDDGQVLLRRADGKTMQSVNAGPGAVNQLAIHPDGGLLATAGERGALQLWDADSGKLVRSLKGHQGDVSAVAFSPDGGLLASGGDDRTVRLWRVSDGQSVPFRAEHGEEVCAVAFSPDGKWLASGAEDRIVRVWEVATGRLVAQLEGHLGQVNTLAFSPDGKWLASAGADRAIRLWELPGGREVVRMTGHAGMVHDLAFSPDGKRLVSAGQDGTVRLWEPHLAQEILTLSGPGGGATSVAFSPDGCRLACGGSDGAVSLWDAPRSEGEP